MDEETAQAAIRELLAMPREKTPLSELPSVSWDVPATATPLADIQRVVKSIQRDELER